MIPARKVNAKVDELEQIFVDGFPSGDSCWRAGLAIPGSLYRTRTGLVVQIDYRISDEPE